MQSLRGVSLPDQNVIDLLAADFVVGWENIKKEGHVGLSHGYSCSQTAVGTTNGAGPRNLQIVVMAADRTVLHVLPGFWHPDDLRAELEFAASLGRLWSDSERSREDKERLFDALHRAHTARFSADTLARSDWQDFDRSFEMNRYAKEPRDTVVLDEFGTPWLVPVCQLVHDRMRARPFVQFDDFDFEAFVDYGRPYYDNNSWIDKGKAFPDAERANERRAKEKAKEQAEIEKQSKAG